MKSEDLLVQAVRSRRYVTCSYDGKPRLLEPHALGRTAKGSLVLRAFQCQGESATAVSAWKLMTVDKMEDLQMTAIAFEGVRDGYRPGDPVMAQIVAELSIEDERAAA